MNEKVKALLSGLGVPAQTLADLQDEEKIKDLDVAEVKKATLSNLKDVFRNDSDFKGEIERGLRASILTSKEKKLMDRFGYLGITEEELSVLPDKNKFDGLIDLLGKKAEAFKGTGGDDEKSKEQIRSLNEQILKFKNEIKRYDEEVIPELKNTVANERKAMKLEGVLRKELGGHKLIIDSDFAYQSVKAQIDNQFDLRMDDAGKVGVFQKGTDNEAFIENQRVSLEELVKKTVTDAKLVQASNGGGGGSRGTGTGDEDDDGKDDKPRYQFQGSAAAAKHAEDLKGTTEE